MHRLPQRSRLNILRLHRNPNLLTHRSPLSLSIERGRGRVYDDRRKPPITHRPIRLRQELDRLEVSKSLAVPFEVGAACGHAVGQHLHLSASDTRTHIAKPVVITDLGMLVMRGRVAGLCGQEACLADHRFVVAEQGPSPAGGDDLVAVEAEDAELPEAAAGLALVGGSQGFGGVLDDGDLELTADFGDGVHVGGHAVEVDRDDRLHAAAEGPAVLQGLAQGVGIHVPGGRFAVDEDRRGAQVGDGVRRCRERHALADHFVAGTHAQQDERQVDGGCARAERCGVRHPGKGAQVAFEGIDMRTQRRYPVRGEGLLHELELGCAHVGRGEEDFGFNQDYD